ncbi:MAG: 2-oxoglutarate dehydrogenase complex dihydrolipoyllysine-residue succinyltransferase [Bacteroidetes bacterium]|nr:2-oxoglutarate dehydrogenase complex dihydrolipoyllysine-residue succinyltransferase [Bacteroidota bacterium]
MIDILVPSPGESISEVEIGSWFAENGAWVDQNQEIASIESEKATLEITAPASGFIEILAKDGDTIEVGAVMGRIKPGKEPSADKESVPSVVRKARQTQAESGNKVKITPVAQQMMNANNLKIEDVISGLKRIKKQDIEVHIGNSTETSDAQTSGREGMEERKRMSLLRRKLGERLVAVKNQTAMLTTFNEVDMSAVMALRNKYKVLFQQKHGVKLGFMSFFTLAAARALHAFPQINAIIDGEDIVQFNYADIGIAIQTPKGLMVPVLRNVQNQTLAQIEASIASLAEKARNNKISIDDLKGGTFSITNGGVFGSLLSTPILNPPQSAILGMHNIVERPIAIDGQVVIRPMMYVALSYDHRIVDGKDSVGFLTTIKEMIENPFKLLDPNAKPETSLLNL